MTDILSFNIRTSTAKSEEDEDYTMLTARPVVNGIPLVDSRYMFDLATLLAIGESSSAEDIFTCSCGHAGCAGIDDGCTIVVDDVSVTWNFPAAPFSETINPTLRKDRDQLSFVFDRKQYFSSMRDLTQSIVEAETNSKLPLHYHCNLVYMVSELRESVSARLIEDKLFFQSRLERENARHDLYKSLTNATIRIRMGQGIVLAIGVENMLTKMAGLHLDEEARNKYIGEYLVPKAIEDRDYLISAVKGMQPSELWNDSYIENPGTEMEESDIEKIIPLLLPGAVVTFVPG